jgi:hypothetical protein
MRKGLKRKIQRELKKRGVCYTYTILGIEFVLDRNKIITRMKAKNEEIMRILPMDKTIN